LLLQCVTDLEENFSYADLILRNNSERPGFIKGAIHNVFTLLMVSLWCQPARDKRPGFLESFIEFRRILSSCLCHIRPSSASPTGYRCSNLNNVSCTDPFSG